MDGRVISLGAVEQVAPASGASAACSSATFPRTVMVTSAAAYHVNPSGAAANTDTYVPAGQVAFFSLPAGQVLNFFNPTGGAITIFATTVRFAG